MSGYRKPIRHNSYGTDEDWGYCVDCGCRFPIARLTKRADGELYCISWLWCAKGKRVRLEVEAEFARLGQVVEEHKVEAVVRRGYTPDRYTKKPKAKRACPCGKDISGSHVTAKFCSAACRQKNKRRLARASGRALA